MKLIVSRGMRCIFLALLTFAMLIGSGVGYAQAADQTVALNPSSSDQTPGSSFSLSAVYNVSDNDNTLSGIGIRFHFDSTKLSFTGWSDVLTTGFLQQDTIPQNDTQNFDNDASTDKFILIAFLDFTGNWPNLALPLELAKLGFTVEGTLIEAATTQLI